MCIILACEAGARPTIETLKTCWQNNPDGGGFAWCEDGRVNGEKGFMTWGEFIGMYADIPTDTPLLVHMRIGTSGGYGGDVTHPFPIDDRLDALHWLGYTCGCAIAHNGVLHDMPTDDKAGVSDTVAFIRDVCAPLSRDRAVIAGGGLAVSELAKLRLARASIGSRLALLDAQGNMRLIGRGWQDVTDGVHASNGGWRAAKWADWFADWECWDDLDEWGDLDDLDEWDQPPLFGECACDTCIEGTCWACPHGLAVA